MEKGHLTFNQVVRGSSPRWLTRRFRPWADPRGPRRGFLWLVWAGIDVRRFVCTAQAVYRHYPTAFVCCQLFFLHPVGLSPAFFVGKTAEMKGRKPIYKKISLSTGGSRRRDGQKARPPPRCLWEFLPRCIDAGSAAYISLTSRSEGRFRPPQEALPCGDHRPDRRLRR